ncbi:hypothetical protein TNCV_3552081 [Trichonephila clavipes]|nr:hypothetical protein TNCV_3552081 [Trichonephila clavipes]
MGSLRIQLTPQHTRLHYNGSELERCERQNFTGSRTQTSQVFVCPQKVAMYKSDANLVEDPISSSARCIIVWSANEYDRSALVRIQVTMLN